MAGLEVAEPSPTPGSAGCCPDRSVEPQLSLGSPSPTFISPGFHLVLTCS